MRRRTVRDREGSFRLIITYKDFDRSMVKYRSLRRISFFPTLSLKNSRKALRSSNGVTYDAITVIELSLLTKAQLSLLVYSIPQWDAFHRVYHHNHP